MYKSFILDYLPPWNLLGKGYIIIFRLNKSFYENNSLFFQNNKHFCKSKFAFFMLVDYASSNVGPYQEFLFIPGKVVYENYRRYTIEKIFVSTKESAYWGRKNWGIPKEIASFSVNEKCETSEWNVFFDGKKIAEFLFKKGKLAFPISTHILPFSFLQIMDNRMFVFDLKAKGYAYWAKLVHFECDAVMFPNFAGMSPLCVLYVKNFHGLFSIPQKFFVQE